MPSSLRRFNAPRSGFRAARSVLVAACFAAVLAACGSDGGSDEPANLLTVSADGSTRIDSAATAQALASLPIQPLSADETASLAYMREEEKLAHDVYTVLAALWAPPIFDNIAASEQTHTEAVLALLTRYSLPDPAATTAPGVFVDAGLQAIYDEYVLRGQASLDAALTVGAEIEELDIRDISAALQKVDNLDIITVYSNLLKGSRNHLRAFVSVLASRGVVYVPKFITPALYQEIISSPMETGPN